MNPAHNAATPGWQMVPVEPTPEMVEASYAMDGMNYGGKPLWKQTVDIQAKARWSHMLSAAPTPPALARAGGDGWRDIAEAPKNGTEVDLWGAREQSPGRVPDCAWLTLASGADWYTRGDAGWECLGAINWHPTHFRPLPAAPNTEGEHGQS